VAINKLSIKTIGSPKYEIADLNNKHAELQQNTTLHKNKLIHEHIFIATRIKEASFLVHCITCGTYYCELSGKAL
jgi:hypothetical protein